MSAAQIALTDYLKAREGRPWTWRDTHYVMTHVRQVEATYQELLKGQAGAGA